MTSCYHCGLPSSQQYRMTVKETDRYFCCNGCMAVASLIMGTGLNDFYKHREALAPTPVENNIESLSIYDDSTYCEDFVQQKINTQGKPVYQAHIQLEGMSCSACAWLIEKHLERSTNSSLISAQVNYSRRILYLEWHPEQIKLSTLLATVTSLGYDISPARHQEQQAIQQREARNLLLRMGVSGIGMMQVGMYAIAMYTGVFQDMTEAVRDLMRYASLLIATLVIFYAAQPFFIAAWHALKNHHLVMDVPVSIALALAYGSSLIATWRGTGEVYFDAVCMFTFFLLCSRYLEFLARSNWTQDIQSKRQTDCAWQIHDDGSLNAVAAKKLRPGDTILIKPGALIPVDGCLLDDCAEVDQAQLTGEFHLLTKTIGDRIYAGSINAGNPIKITTLKTQDQSSLAQIESIVERAQMHKPAIVSLVDRLSGWFVASVLLLALISYIFWVQVDPDNAFWIALSVLVVSCPCALSLATPTALTVLMHRLRKQGILVQSPAALETLTQVDQIIFDKTGTLTEGKYQLNQVEDFSGEGKVVQLSRAWVLEKLSNHPLAHAFKPIDNSIHCEHWHYCTGQGIEATMNGKSTRIGNQDFVAQISTAPTTLKTSTTEPSHAIKTKTTEKKIYLGNSDGWLASFSLSDRLRPELGSLIQYLKHHSKRFQLALLSGDPSDSVALLAKHVGIKHWQNSMTAEDKLVTLQNMQKEGKVVLAIGDGLNDAPLLAAANTSIAMYNAVGTSKQHADFLLLSNNLLAIPQLFDGAKRCHTVIKQNLLWALSYNVIVIPIAMIGMIPPWLAALGMSASSAIVVLNAFRAKPGLPTPQTSAAQQQKDYSLEVATC